MGAEETRIQRAGRRAPVLLVPSSSRFREKTGLLTDPENLAGQVLADTERHGPRRYVLKQFLGCGASSSVYAALREDIGTAYAVKLLAADADEFTRALFLREAELVCRIKARRVIRGIDRGELRGRPYVVLPRTSEFLVDTLDAQRESGVLAHFDWIATNLADVADALAELHRHGVFHRDIKPANLTLHERFRIVDLGVAYILEAEDDPFNELVVGTPAYMAPEQLDGHTRPSSDLYAVGVILYEMLTGRTPSSARDLAARAAEPRIAHDPRDLAPDVPAPLADLCRRLLDPDPRRRGDDAARVARELRESMRVSGGRPSSALVPAPTGQVPAVAAEAVSLHAADRGRSSAVAAGALVAMLALLAARQWLPALLGAAAMLRSLAGLREQLRLEGDRLIVREGEASAPWSALVEVNTTSSTQELELVLRMQGDGDDTIEQTFTFPRLERPVEEIVAAIAARSPSPWTRFNGKDRFSASQQPRRMPDIVRALTADAGLRASVESTAVQLPKKNPSPGARGSRIS